MGNQLPSQSQSIEMKISAPENKKVEVLKSKPIRTLGNSSYGFEAKKWRINPNGGELALN